MSENLRQGIMHHQALSDISILDLTAGIPGSYCTKLLADLGAEVIKVETPGKGDETRRHGPFPQDQPHPEKSGLFLYFNTNKKGITLDLNSAVGAKLLGKMVCQVDILVEDLDSEATSRLGLEYETLEKMNPGLIVTSISDFGKTGPYRHYKSTNIVRCALSGLMCVTGDPERKPLRPAGFLVEYIGGLSALIGSLTALAVRDQTGAGQQVDVSVIEAGTILLEVELARYANTGYISRRGLTAPGFYPTGVYPCKDGYTLINIVGDAWRDLAAWLERPELDDERFASALDREPYKNEIDPILRAALTERGKEELFHSAQEWRLPFAYVCTVEDLLRDPQNKAREFFVDIEHPETGLLSYPGAPFKMSKTPCRAGRAPLLGEHNEEICCGRLGLTASELATLRHQGII